MNEYMRKAISLAEDNLKTNVGGPFGAVVVKSGKIIGRGSNHVLGNNDPTAHAEIRVLQKACKKLETDKLVGYSVFVTLEPCAMCAAALSLARIDTLYFGAYDPKTGGICQGPALYTHSQIHHKPNVIGGIQADICGQLLRDFFKLKRGKHV